MTTCTIGGKIGITKVGYGKDQAEWLASTAIQRFGLITRTKYWGAHQNRHNFQYRGGQQTGGEHWGSYSITQFLGLGIRRSLKKTCWYGENPDFRVIEFFAWFVLSHKSLTSSLLRGWQSSKPFRNTSFHNPPSRSTKPFCQGDSEAILVT